MPRSEPTLLVVVNTWQHHRLAAVVFWVGSTAVFLLIGGLTEGAGLRALRNERERVAALYHEQEG